MPEPPPQTPKEIVEALRRDLADILDRLPEDAELAVSFDPLMENEAQ